MSIVGMAPNTLHIVGLSKSYGRHPVLDGIDLTATGGRILAVTGSNGSGKSTLLRCVAGLASHRGTVTFRGEPVASMRRHLGYLPQSVGLPPWATVGEVIAFFARLREADPEDLPLPGGFVPEHDRQIGVLSGGQRQRVALAVSLLGDPSLLLLDEPFANLDDAARSTLAGALAHAAHDGRTVVIATPIEADLGPLDRTVVGIVDGRIAAVPTHRASGCGENGKALIAPAPEALR